MAKFTGETSFANGQAVTATKLNDITSNLKIAQDSFANTFSVTDGVTSIADGGIKNDMVETSSSATTGLAGNKLRDDAITTAKLPNSTGTSDGVTYAKMQFVSATAKVLGRKTASAGVVEEISIDDNILSGVSSSHDTVASAKAITDLYGRAAQVSPSSVAGSTESVTLANGLIIKFGSIARAANSTTLNFSDYGGNFTACLAAIVTGFDADGTAYSEATGACLKSKSASQLEILSGANVNTIDFVAIGY